MNVDDAGEPKRRSRQKQVGDALRRETRARLLEAAADEFATHGYAETTVTRLAAAAGVSVPTLYLTWGSKRELLRGYMEESLSGSASSPEDAASQFAGRPPLERLTGLADLFVEVAERAATGWRLYREASAVDAEIAADWDELQLLRHRLFARILDGIPEAALADGLTREAAIDTAWVVASPDTYDLLVRRLGYKVVDFRNWMKQTLTSAILVPAAGADATRAGEGVEGSRRVAPAPCEAVTA
ncbi:TetR/AcrR family transcriptional regulator [Streptomyces sp. NBC_00442]|uniref:TetR/AcrR family transcriptional regulator n=1 Tax=Streptomyces sp. NBC_00442 TaxID=2903651 RepID=UPI002E1B4B4A